MRTWVLVLAAVAATAASGAQAQEKCGTSYGYGASYGYGTHYGGGSAGHWAHGSAYGSYGYQRPIYGVPPANPYVYCAPRPVVSYCPPPAYVPCRPRPRPMPYYGPHHYSVLPHVGLGFDLNFHAGW